MLSVCIGATCFDGAAVGYTHIIRAIGGMYSASIALKAARAELLAAFEGWLGMPLTASADGAPAFSGRVVRLELELDGARLRRSLEPDRFVNAIRALYSDDIGNRADTGWIEDAPSIAQWGRVERVVSLGGATDEQAQVLAGATLAEQSSPDPVMTGVGMREARLVATAAGGWYWFACRHRDATVSGEASAMVETVVDAVAEVARGRIDANTLPVKLDCTIPQREADLLAGIAEQGDEEGNRYAVGVYGGALEYTAQQMSYLWRDGRVYQGGALVHPALVRPHAAVRVGVGGRVRRGYVEEVRYDARTGLRLRLTGTVGVSAAIAEQIRR